eukprot:CAMPEP_0202746422 /NCGR_PEP_ID=MMETSP1388-20130828/8140_1 /ASSEMBLY_ACC=CAM_ASM_000864 /TAXON_ID=37098 /ORGANISM="Isochrysis sp, Strain CCMP1244" /LENGTH=549 /DNA_ID=CAMNT_0049413683 /DNA_START=26 /DNA_END=1675 /DNA_ORIENTATION=+
MAEGEPAAVAAGGGGGGTAHAGTPAAHAGTPAHAALFGSEAAPPPWIEQGFEFSAAPESRCGLLQGKNGPCGVLAAVNAELLAQKGCPPPSAAATEADLRAALAAILWRCASADAPAGAKDSIAQEVVLARWEGAVGGPIVTESFAADGAASVAAKLAPLMPALRQKGGVVLLCYACVLTRGVEAVRADVALDNGSGPLIAGPHALCGTELMTLLMAGRARGNVGAYGQDGAKVTWREPSPFGLLSRDELETGVPLADPLKSPPLPVYVLHGGDHFTVAWIPLPAKERFEARVRALFASARGGGSGGDANSAAAEAVEAATAELQAAPPPPATQGAVDLALWNGLPPARGLRRLRLRGVSDGLAPAAPAPPSLTPSHWRLSVGEVESVVQAAKEDKASLPAAWREHRYELSLVTKAVAEEDVASAPRPPDAPPPTLLPQGPPPAAGEAWRCASCYNSRFKTMCFGENPAPAAAACKFCGQAQQEAGWTVWMRYADLPAPVARRVDRMAGPKVLAVLRTRWPDVSLWAVAGEVEAEVGTAAAAGVTLPAV